MEKRQVRIEDWKHCIRVHDATHRLSGKVYGHVNFSDGSDVITSPIVKDESKTTGKVETKNTIYILGKERKKDE